MAIRFAWVLPLLLFVSTPVAAQLLPISIAIDARAGMVVPTGDFASSDDGFASESGIGYAIGGSLYPIRSVGLFAGYQRSEFGCDQCAVLGLDDVAIVEGWEGGIHLTVPIAGSPIAPWIRGGAIHQILLFTGEGGEMSSEPETGFMAGAGVTIPITAGVELNPAARYFAVPAELDFTILPDRSLDVSAYSVDLGVSFRF